MSSHPYPATWIPVPSDTRYSILNTHRPIQPSIQSSYALPLCRDAVPTLPKQEGRLAAPFPPASQQFTMPAVPRRQAYLAAGIPFSVYQPSLCQRVSPAFDLMSPRARCSMWPGTRPWPTTRHLTPAGGRVGDLAGGVGDRVWFLRLGVLALSGRGRGGVGHGPAQKRTRVTIGHRASPSSPRYFLWAEVPARTARNSEPSFQSGQRRELASSRPRS